MPTKLNSWTPDSDEISQVDPADLPRSLGGRQPTRPPGLTASA